MLPYRIRESPGSVYYISPTGSDATGNGTLGNPWLQPEFAVTQVPFGSTIKCLPGTYALAGDEQGFSYDCPVDSPITIEANDPTNKPIFSGGRFYFTSASYWRLRNLKITAASPDGIKITGDSHHIEIVGCEVYSNTGQGIITSEDVNGKPSHLQILDSIIRNNGTDTNLDHGIYVASLGGPKGSSVIANCVIHSNAAYGIQAYPNADGLLITGCTINNHTNKSSIVIGGGPETLRDDFNRADEAAIGGAWTANAAGLGRVAPALVGNTIRGGTVAGGAVYKDAFWNTVKWGPNLYAAATISATEPDGRMWLQLITTTPGQAFCGYELDVRMDSLRVRLYKTTWGVSSQLGSDVISVSGAGVNSRWALRLNPTHVQVWHKPSGGSWALVMEVADTTFRADQTTAAIAVAGTTQAVTDFYAGDTSTDNLTLIGCILSGGIFAVRVNWESFPGSGNQVLDCVGYNNSNAAEYQAGTGVTYTNCLEDTNPLYTQPGTHDYRLTAGSPAFGLPPLSRKDFLRGTDILGEVKGRTAGAYGENRLVDPGMENAGNGDWEAKGAVTLAEETTTVHGGTRAKHLSGTGSRLGLQTTFADRPVVSPSTEYVIEFWVRATNSMNIEVGWDEYTSGDNFIKTEFGSTAVTGGVWTRVFKRAVVDATAAKVQPYISSPLGHASSFIFRTDDARFYEYVAPGYSAVLPYVTRARAGVSVALPYKITSLAGRSLATPYQLDGWVGRSLVLPYKVRTRVGRSLVLPYFVFAFYELDEGGWQPPATAGDLYLSGLPFPEVQDHYRKDQPINRTRATATWHHTMLNRNWGAYAVVKTGGPLSHLVGECVLITYKARGKRRQVAAFVHDEAEMVAADISLARRAYAEIGLLPLWPIKVEVEVLT